MTSRALVIFCMLAAFAHAQDGAWDVPRAGEESSPEPIELLEATPVAEPPAAEPGQELGESELTFDPATFDPRDHEAAMKAVAAAMEEGDERTRRAFRTASGTLEQAFSKDIEGRSPAFITDETRAFVMRSLALSALEEALLAGAPVSATLKAPEVRVGVPAALRITIPIDDSSASDPSSAEPGPLATLGAVVSGDSPPGEALSDFDALGVDFDAPGPSIRLEPQEGWDGARFGEPTSTVGLRGWEIDVPVQFVREGDVSFEGLVVDVTLPLASDAPIGTLELTLTEPAVVSLDMPATEIRRVDGERLAGLELPMPTVSVILSLLVILGGLFVIGLVAYAAMPSMHVPPAIVIPAERTASEALAGLRARMPQTTDGIPPFIDDVSGVLRTYIEGKFGVAAPDLTTDEFLNVAAARHPALAERRDTLRAFLDQCDLVKFANHRPTLDSPPALLATAETFVEDTRMVDREVDESGATDEPRSEGVAA